MTRVLDLTDLTLFVYLTFFFVRVVVKAYVWSSSPC